MSERLRYTTMSGERRRNVYFGCQYQVAVGASTGRARIAVRDCGGFGCLNNTRLSSG